MSLATAAAVAAILLLIASQIQRRTEQENVLLSWIVRVLVVLVIALVAAYLYQRAVS